MTHGWGARLPSLGSRGEGWFLGQMALLGAILFAGLALGNAWAGSMAALAAAAGLVLVIAGGALILRGLFELGGDLTPWPYPQAGARLVVTGVYALVRHPLYGGLVLGALGWSLLMASPAALLLAVVLAAFLDLKARREEAWLEQRHPDYPGYAARTRRLIPWLY